MRKLRSVIFGLGAVLAVPSAWAAGFQLNEFSAAAQGRANAGETAMADTAAALARNSAVMGNFEGSSISVVYHYIDPKVDVKGTVGTGTPLAADGTKKGIAPSAHIPGFYYIQGIDDQWAVGLSLNSYFGLATDYGDNYAGSEFANKTSIKTYYLTPHVSFKPIESLTLGLGLSYIYGEGEIKNTATAGIEIASSSTVPKGTPMSDVDGDGSAFGYTVGLMWNADENTRVGFSYRSRVDLKLKGDVKTLTGTGFVDSTGQLTLNLPEVYELGVAHDLNDKFTLMGGLQKTGWHRFKELKGKSNGQEVFQKDENWRDAYRISAGGEWHVIDMLTLRGGIAYDESPVENADRSLSIPDAARKWFTLGATVNMGAGGSLDLAFAYLNGSKVSVNETSRFGQDFSGGLSKTDAFIYSVGYNISF